ncbi:calcitonin receptor-stimulating peptide 2-like [Chiloscyllium punctatum]|uniref:calcitonin receptor-stimulating peptide 2-like n=1 Tax=Chiloscyllium punctatum TaxID=137246 RepID=UPI003B636A8E
MVSLSYPLSIILACAMAAMADSDLPSLRSPASRHFGKSVTHRGDGLLTMGPRGHFQQLNPTKLYKQGLHKQRPPLLLQFHKQKRSCNVATCVIHRLADFLSRSGALSSIFIPTDVGPKAFGRKRRGILM